MNEPTQALLSPTKSPPQTSARTTRRGGLRLPKYRHHKGSGQAVVTLAGIDHYLGAYDTPASRQKYTRLIAEWETNNRRVPIHASHPELTVCVLIDAFWEHAKKYYRKRDGSPSSELSTFKAALRPLHRLYGSTLAVDFGPRALKAVRNEMVEMGWCRSHINKQVSRIRMVFRWAVGEELLDSSVYERLRALSPLKRGRCDARESSRVRPVSDEMIEAVRPFVSRQVWAIIRLQRLTGARAGEIVTMRPIDLDMSDDTCWVYTPAEHKTAHHGHIRQIPLNIHAQAVIRPFLADRPLESYPHDDPSVQRSQVGAVQFDPSESLSRTPTDAISPGLPARFVANPRVRFQPSFRCQIPGLADA